jgi:hypothetical protein
MPKTQRTGLTHKEVLKARKRLSKRLHEMVDENAFEDELQEQETDCDKIKDEALL